MEIDRLTAIIRDALPQLKGMHESPPYLMKREILGDDGMPIDDEDWFYYDGDINVRQFAELIAKGTREDDA